MTAYLDYLNKLATALGLQNLPPAERNALLEELDIMVFRSVLFRAITSLNKQDREDLHLLLNEANENMRMPYEFLRKKVPNFSQLIKEEVQKTQKETEQVLKYFEV
jgi:hypothetical protein